MIAEIVELTFLALTIAIIGRALLSWFPIDPRNPIAEMLVKVTDPILSPIRSIMPRLGMFGLAPLVAIILLQVIGGIIVDKLR